MAHVSFLKHKSTMNKSQKKELGKVVDDLTSISSTLESIKDEEEMKKDNLPESLQYSSRADELEQCVDTLSEAIDSIEDAIGTLRELT